MSTPEPMDVTTPMSLDVLALINDARMQYGLRHQDYQRYREYSAHRLRRLRQILNMTQTNSKNTNRQKELPENFTDPRYLHLYVYDTERAWAYAMELKQESTNSMDTRKRHHLTKRLKRAAQHAEKLVIICEQNTVDARSVLDAKAYAATMKGYLYFEQQQWQQAIDQFVESRTIYERFASNNNNVHQEALYYAAMDEIDPNIRFCAYKLQLNGSGSAQDIETLVANLKQQRNVTGMDLLEAQLAKVGEEHRKEQAQALAHMTWRHEQFDVKNVQLADAIAKAQETTASSSLVSTNGAVARYDGLLSDWADAEKRIKKLIKEDKEAVAKVTSSRSAKTTQELEWVHAFISYHFYAYSIQRNLALIDEIKSSNGKVQNMIKLWDDILKNVDYMRDLPRINESHDFEVELNILTNYYKAQRCILVALAYVELRKTPEALALYERSQVHIAHTKQGIQQSQPFAEDAVLKVSMEDVTQLEQIVRTGNWKAQASWYLENEDTDMDNQMEDQQYTLTKKMDQLHLNSTDEIALIKRLDVYPSSITGNNNVPHLIDFPPSFTPVPCKPFYFDLAANHIKYPSTLDERASAAKSSGLWKFFGFGN
ncbi:uncharacterized protein BX664DRAFT_335181 [Halteromyces radiatus]|uniref:uncharacterized protein n=1 Tax=Halteromyces radiatus TaxID=101107 RepID=UPI00222046F7|nr:uncharacterized protein BX664DRAFT_335181 [Halteromyces radiatus]KAI8086210.1 hypothetical protein BX664DRAFT_335181 [Halteromyces radiatus]